MTQYDITQREGLPNDLQTLLRDLPRDGWEAHPNFARATRNWMGAHQKFRALGTALQGDAEDFLDTRIPEERYAERLAHGGHALVQHLHGHHAWEDHRFFPELEAVDPRFARGLEMLESDHVALDGLLDTLTRQGNRVVQLATLAPAQMGEEARPLRDTLERLNRFLLRHLTDEEDLVVPILLHHKLRG
ncbi:hemerythrin domain-containing protein [Salipiger sp. P9]|uniref:hemerythrin domain-containing protein n=1 Tax=Salipiger pentaromativorans TaxID=2943193 RepID=UPI0021574DB3|nr:hemerythrin domain-containing protein [Salipiger pentaromativorans]MCR8550706.1 hemerythrin domain-containing protein [Salipiger pentaromativorans]